MGPKAYIILEVVLKKKNIKLQMENQGQGLRKAVVTQFRGIPGRGDYLKREGGRICTGFPMSGKGMCLILLQ